MWVVLFVVCCIVVVVWCSVKGRVSLLVVSVRELRVVDFSSVCWLMLLGDF